MSSHLSVNDKYQSAGSLEDHLAVKRGVEEVHLAGEVPDLEVDEGAAGDVVLVDFVGALEEKRLVGRHLVKYNLHREARGITVSVQHLTDPQASFSKPKCMLTQCDSRKPTSRIHPCHGPIKPPSLEADADVDIHSRVKSDNILYWLTL